jgi:glycosyltransferase involved in cell wall biosynthesis
MTHVSVVMTAFNESATIVDALGSVLTPAPQDLEVVVVDDGSTDGTAALVETVGDPRIRLLRAQHIGRPAAVNLAVAQATGDLIAIADADDRTLPERWPLQVDAFRADTSLDVCGGQMIAVAGDRRWRMRYPLAHEQIVDELNFGRMPIAHAGVMFKRDWFEKAGGLDTSYARVEDFELYYRMRATTRFHAIGQSVVEYAFRTLSSAQWRSDAAYHARAIGKPPEVDGIQASWGYVKYRVAVAAQARGLRLSPRAGGRV